MSEAKAEPRPKKSISAFQLAANRANSKLSSGPKTTQGLARSKMNGLIHGCAANELVLPGEHADELQDRVDTWIEDLGVRTAPERYFAERAAHSSWRLDRCLRAENATLTR